MGEVNGVLTGDNDGGSPALSLTNDQFTNVVLDQPGSSGVNYNFGERTAGGQVTAGQTASIGFWQNKNGQELIKSLNGGEDSALLATWLSTTFPNMYGTVGWTDNEDVATTYQELFKRNAKTSPGGPPKLDAQVLAVALATYVTTQSYVTVYYVDNTTDVGFIDSIESYGLDVTVGGLGSATFNVGDGGEAFGVADNTDMPIVDLLLATDSVSANGLLYDLDGDGEIGEATIDGARIDEELLRVLANEVYSAINEAGGN